MSSSSILLKQGTLINGDESVVADVFIQNGVIERIDRTISTRADREINCEGKFVLPGVIDTHVHFREPGMTKKADIATESRAAIAGGVTTIFDMPNTVPQTITIKDVKDKKEIYAGKCLCNFGVYIGATRDNLEELKKADDDNTIPAIKIFMAESAGGNMTLDKEEYLAPIFENTRKLIALHAEDEQRRLHRLACYERGVLEDAYGYASENPFLHFVLRENLVAALGTKKAVEFALATNHPSHILHISTAEELEFLRMGREAGLVSGETCPHYLLFTSADFEKYGSSLITNPVVKTKKDQEALWVAITTGLISQIATDHAPHLKEEKDRGFPKAPAGVPSVQFSLALMMNAASIGKLTYNQVVQLQCENPAINYGIARKGFFEEGFDADIVIYDPARPMTITNDIVLSKCGWTPYNGFKVSGSVEKTIVNGQLIYDSGQFVAEHCGKSIVIEEEA